MIFIPQEGNGMTATVHIKKINIGHWRNNNQGWRRLKGLESIPVFLVMMSGVA